MSYAQLFCLMPTGATIHPYHYDYIKIRFFKKAVNTALKIDVGKGN